MTGSKYAEADMIDTKMEKMLPPALTYAFRKAVLHYIRFQFWKARQAAKLYSFYIETEVDDREAWKWRLRRYIPLYTVEKVN